MLTPDRSSQKAAGGSNALGRDTEQATRGLDAMVRLGALRKLPAACRMERPKRPWSWHLPADLPLSHSSGLAA
jgi:hypothetical protein